MSRNRPKLLVGLLFFLLFLASIIPAAKAWQQGDFEIFDLVDELEKAEGAKIDFYAYIGVAPSATLAEINRAYKRKSLEIHPDKNKHDPKSKERFARLGSITTLLRDPERRERYDFFHKNGVPRWRGTDYLYRRYRPGFGTAIVFILLISGALQYVSMHINYHRDRDKIRRWVKDGREALAKYAPKSQGPPTRGKTYIDLNHAPMKVDVIGDGHIIFYPADGDAVDMNEEWLPKPSVLNVFLIAWPMAMTRRLTGQKSKDDTKEVEDIEVEMEDLPTQGMEREDGKGLGSERKLRNSPKPTVVAGGRRRTGRR